MHAVPRDWPALTVGITTRNRPESLARCLTSLAAFERSIAEVVVVDDSSDVPIDAELDGIPQSIREKLVLVNQPGRQGYIVARNAIVRRAQTAFVLMLDDDTVVRDGKAIADAIDVLSDRASIGAVGFAQAEGDGSPWPASAQPSVADYPCLVPAFIGFAHLLRRDAFLAVGGYREAFYFYGEEKDFCLRLLDAGREVAYLPHARVVHLPDPEGRSPSRYLRQVIRNDCLGALYNEPFPLPLATVPLRLFRYFRMRSHGRIADAGGFAWILRELAGQLPDVARQRKPVRWATLRRWRALRALPERFDPSAVSIESSPAEERGDATRLANADAE